MAHIRRVVHPKYKLADLVMKLIGKRPKTGDLFREYHLPMTKQDIRYVLSWININ
jgi:hypothetical protein